MSYAQVLLTAAEYTMHPCRSAPKLQLLSITYSAHPHMHAGNAHSFNTTMPRMLRALSSILEDLSKHTIVTAIGEVAQRMCGDVMRSGGHLAHCAMEQHMRGPDGPVDWGTSW